MGRNRGNLLCVVAVVAWGGACTVDGGQDGAFVEDVAAAAPVAPEAAEGSDPHGFVVHKPATVPDASPEPETAPEPAPDAMLDAGSDALAETPAQDASLDASDATLDAALDAAPVPDPDASTSVVLDGGALPPPPTVTSFDDGLVARCQVRTDHTLWCWGEGTYSSPTWHEPRFPLQVGADADWSSVSVGRESICGLRGSGSLWCFGQVYHLDANALPPSNVPLKLEQAPVQIGTDDNWREVSVGLRRYLAVKHDGTLWRWGDWFEVTTGTPKVVRIAQPTQVGSDNDWASVRAGLNLSCAIKTNGALHCIGINGAGNVGDGTKTPRPDLTPVSGGGVWTSVALASVTCGVRDDGTLWCWGVKPALTPTQMGTDSDWVEVAGHADDVVGRRASGDVYSILSTLDGKLEIAPIVLSGDYVALSGHCGQKLDGTLWCWDSFTPRGDGSGNLELTPVRVGTESDWVSVTGVLGLHTDGRVDATWAMPSLATLSPVRELSGSGGNACAIRDDHTLWCAGFRYSPVGPDGVNTLAPVQQGSDANWLHITALDQSWECAIRGDVASGQGSLWCHLPGNAPGWVQIGTTSDWTAVSVYDRACGLRADGSLWCWKMSLGCCDGHSNAVKVSELAPVSPDDDWTAISVGYGFKCGLRADGSLWCSGKNDFGQLGIGTRSDTTSMVQVLPGTEWSAISAGGTWACGIQVDGSLWCWGDDTRGQLGLGAPGATRLTPQRVGSFSDWDFVEASKWPQVSCAIRQGQLHCWGDNHQGHVTRTRRSIRPPVQVLSGLQPNEALYCPYPSDADHDGYAACYGDCNDVNADVSPYENERCNGLDDDCDGELDEGCL